MMKKCFLGGLLALTVFAVSGCGGSQDDLNTDAAEQSLSSEDAVQKNNGNAADSVDELVHVYFSPQQRTLSTYYQGNLLFSFMGNLYELDTSGDTPVLSPWKWNDVQDCYVTVFEQFVSDGENNVYVLNGDQKLEIDAISPDGERSEICSVDEDGMNYLTSESRLAVVGSDCYVMAYNSMYGPMSLARVSLDVPDTAEVLWKWEAAVTQVLVDSIQYYDGYLLIHYSEEGTPALYVYDTKKEEMSVDGDAFMAYAGYYDGMLYYLDLTAAQIGVYDLENGSDAEQKIALADTDLLSMDADILYPAHIACDMDYIYVSQFGSGAGEEIDASQDHIWIYDYEGNLVDRIDFAKSYNGYEELLENSSFQSLYMCSTEDVLLIGCTAYAIPDTVMILDKGEIGEQEKELHLLSEYLAQ